MGKRDKEHRKKVMARNQKLKGIENAIQKLFNESMKKKLEELKKQKEIQMSANTQTGI